MARPTPTSAAATAMMNRAKVLPSTLSLNRLKASRLMFTALRISSMLISTITAFFRAMTPYTPMQNSTAPSSRNSLSSMSVLPSQDDGADDGDQQEERQRPERHQVRREDAVGDRLRGDRGGIGRHLLGVVAVDQHVGHDAEHHQGDR